MSELNELEMNLVGTKLAVELYNVIDKFHNETKYLNKRQVFIGILEGILTFNALAIDIFSQLPTENTESKDQYLKDFLPKCFERIKEKLEAMPTEEVKTMLAALKTH